jgi:O-antigen/teichoic acid export membrane protein
MSSFKKALAFSFVGKYLGILLQLISMIILTRILTPEDYGIYTIAIIFVLLANILRESGVSNYLIKEKELNHEKIRSAFSLMLIIAFIVGTCLYYSANFVADFYGEEKLVFMIQLLSINIFISPFGTIIVTTLRRQLHFKPIVIVTLISQIISISAMIVLAKSGYAELTLVYGSLINSICNFFFIQFFRPPNLPNRPGIGKITEIISYSKYVGAATIISQVGQQAAELAVGKHINMESVGQLNRANNTAGLFNQLVTEGLNPVLTPYISRLNRNNIDIRTPLKRLTNVQLTLAWPFYAILALLAEPIVVILYGKQWLIASVYLKIFCFTRMVSFAFQHIDAIFMGKGLAKQVMKIQVSLSVLHIVVVVTFIPRGIIDMLIAIALILPLVRTCIYLHMIKIHLKVSKTEYVSWLSVPLGTTLLTAAPVILCMLVIDFQWNDNILVLFSSLCISVIIWIISVWNQEIGNIIKPLLRSVNIKKSN